jgi:hypothetical protein
MPAGARACANQSSPIRSFLIDSGACHPFVRRFLKIFFTAPMRVKAMSTTGKKIVSDKRFVPASGACADRAGIKKIQYPSLFFQSRRVACDWRKIAARMHAAARQTSSRTASTRTLCLCRTRFLKRNTVFFIVLV